MADTKKIMFKLQKALQQQGIIVSISTNQFYSEDQKRFINQFIAKNGKKVVCKSCSQIEVINCLKDILNKAREENRNE